MPNKEPIQSTSKSQSSDVPTKVREAVEQVRSNAVERVESTRSAAASAKEHAAERVRKLGGAVRKIGEHMRIEEQFYIADRANDASQRLESVADYISEAELSTLLHDAEEAARTRPALVFGGTFLLGLALGRLLKPEPAGASVQSEGDGTSRRERTPREPRQLPTSTASKEAPR